MTIASTSFSACICSSLKAGLAFDDLGLPLHHAFCPQWTMLINQGYHPEQCPAKYAFALYPAPNLYYALIHRGRKFFLDFHKIYHLSASVRQELTHEFTPATEYLTYKDACPADQDIIYRFAPSDDPYDLSHLSPDVVEAFIFFVHDSPMLDAPRQRLSTKEEWVQLCSLAQLFDMQELFLYALNGLKMMKKKRRSSGVEVVINGLLKVVKREGTF